MKIFFVKSQPNVYINFIERYCASFVATSDEIDPVLWEISKDEQSNYVKFLYPPIDACIECGSALNMHNNPSKAMLYSLDGPIPASKVTLECKNCSISYGVDTYSKGGLAKYYCSSSSTVLIEASGHSYLTKSLYRWIPSLSNHSWVSFSGFTEAYNEVYDMGTHECHESGKLTSKVVAKAFWKEEVREEIQDLGVEWVFGKNCGLENSGEVDDAIAYVESQRVKDIYHHNCSSACKAKGCGQLYVIDGNWKLRHAHCMWKVSNAIPGFVNYPDVCPLSPVKGHAFCEEHCRTAKAANYPTPVREFLKFCGVSKTKIDEEVGNDALQMDSHTISTNEDIDQGSSIDVDSHLTRLNQTARSSVMIHASDIQGTSDFIKENPEFIEECREEIPMACNKDTGSRKTLQTWSRGVMFVVSGGGHVEYWQPLYRSESPSQAFLILLLWMHRRYSIMLENGLSKEEVEVSMDNCILAYDNMCHLDNLLVARKDLPFQSPFDKMWARTTKVIDRLHIKNHKDPKCKTIYNPEGKVPEGFNTMAAEQTFVWASRFKKIVCAMPRNHQFFYLHRMIKRRNAYTSRCHLQGKDPVLPSVSKTWKPQQ